MAGSRVPFWRLSPADGMRPRRRRMSWAATSSIGSSWREWPLSMSKWADSCKVPYRDPTHFGLVLSFLRDQSFWIKPPVSASARAVRSRSGGASNVSEVKTTSLTGASPSMLAAHGLRERLTLPIDDDLRETLSLVRELDYYGLLNYVLPREVGTELAQWSQDFAHVFTVESYHHKAATLWVDHLAREADVAGTLPPSPTTIISLSLPLLNLPLFHARELL